MVAFLQASPRRASIVNTFLRNTYMVGEHALLPFGSHRNPSLILFPNLLRVSPLLGPLVLRQFLPTRNR